MGKTAESIAQRVSSDHPGRFRVIPLPMGTWCFPILAWRLHNDRDDHVDCFFEVTVTGAYRIRLQCGGSVTFTALAVDCWAARRVIDEQREELLRRGWQPST